MLCILIQHGPQKFMNLLEERRHLTCSLASDDAAQKFACVDGTLQAAPANHDFRHLVAL